MDLVGSRDSIHIMATEEQPENSLPISDSRYVLEGEEDDGLCEGCHVLSKEQKPPMHETYQYHALHRPQDTIRLLAWPANPEDVACLLEASIADLPLYETVSYAWGYGTGWPLELNKDVGTATNSTIHRPSNGDKTTLHVSVTVSHILYFLRPASGWRLLWIDAICINQSDNAEKSLQIPMMDRIYSKAERVIIWCPPCRIHLAKDVETTIDKLNSWRGREAEILEALNNGSFGDAASEDRQDWLPWKLPPTHEFHISKACIDALTCVMRLPWFERVWTLQELILAREAVIYFGPITLRWEELISACLRAHACDFLVECRRLAEIDVLRNLYMESGSVDKTTCGRELTYHKTLANILRIIRPRKATNARDKVYGIIGLLSRHDIASPGLIVDYSLPVLDVNLSACIACMEVQGAHANIAFLQDAGSEAVTNQKRPHARVTTEGEYWPSWIPDWTEALPRSSGLLMGCLQANGSSVSKGRASNATIFAQHEHIGRVGKGPCLRVQGVRVLTIQGFIPRRGNDLFSDYYEVLGKAQSSYCNTSLSIQHAYSYVASAHIHPRRDNQVLPQVTSIWSYIKDDINPPDYDLGKGNTEVKSTTGNGTTVEPISRRMHGRIGLDIPESLNRKLEQVECRANDGKESSNFQCFVSTTGFMGLVYPNAQPGDEIVVLFGLEMPFVVRPDAEPGHYQLIGECFVLGLIEGEAMEGLEDSQVEDIYLC